MDLTTLRAEMDNIDDELCALFLRRMAVSEKVAHHKREHGGPVLRPEREAEILDRMAEKAGPDMAVYVRGFFEAILAASRQLQEDILGSAPK